ncbi:unnamed protein product [Didymodactylos carnosus]|uniref:CCD97-like C-terminal domain-containing protein n=1 Tax=Didymodactylos carnosus TaxID=1234261 RepID=A0A8S2JDD7_9BILA|nr:unnamed protein product [Didymodactylos carnosus]CAF3804829.1 unnamed protein product [Didymodactylos carnosus]
MVIDYNNMYISNVLSSTVRSMFDRICTSNAVIKSQQRNEPDLTLDEKYSLLNELYLSSPSKFLYRYGLYLNAEDLKSNFNETIVSASDESIQVYIQELLSTINKRKKVAANRRYVYMQQLLKQGVYFSDEEMKTREPLLFEQLIEHYSDKKSTRKPTSTTGVLSDFFMEHLESVHYNERVKQEKQQEYNLNGEYSDNEQLENDDDDDEEESEMEDDSEPPPPKSKYSDEERELYRQEFLSIMKRKFLNGQDLNIDYSSIDNNQDYDEVEIYGQDEEEKYFDKENPYTYDERLENGDEDFSSSRQS